MNTEDDLTFYTNRCRHQAVVGSPQRPAGRVEI